MCTSLRIRSSDGTVIVGRTMEYALEVNWELRAVPRGVTQSSSAPDGAGLTWTGTNGYVGMGIGDTTTLGMTLPAQPSVPRRRQRTRALRRSALPPELRRL
ncbi:MAG: linear amide C-N hydrolase [Mycobacteriaceae bacterium]